MMCHYEQYVTSYISPGYQYGTGDAAWCYAVQGWDYHSPGGYTMVSRYPTQLVRPLIGVIDPNVSYP